ncbi:SRPBCC domain-containing protein [Lewinella sp. IMCC34191]|uniref:SRPBCC family protein n=1 Tax=Lewinella sp. IMCC34191 TaxID=2259172 RepID=UPI000E25D7E4|nr:SRPBCC domain-containing protein [Lewinella sp. IMCC34191]
MKPTTQVHAADGRQELTITRDFDLPLHRLFRAFEDPDIVARWMGTKVVKLENRRHGGWEYETSGPNGQVVFRAHGVIHDFVPNQRITRTFEMDNNSFPPQLEFLEFSALSERTSHLRMHIVFKSVADRNQLVQLPFAKGLGMAHDRLQRIMDK